MSQKDKENATLRRKVEDLKSTLRALRDDPLQDNRLISSNQDHLILQLRNQIDQMQSESFMRDSQLQMDEQKLSKMEESRQILKRETECCRNLVHDLVKLIKFKDFEQRIIKKQYIEGGEGLEELLSKYQMMKPQEQVVMERQNLLTKNEGRHALANPTSIARRRHRRRDRVGRLLA